MKKKLKMLLSKLRESKFFKIFFSTFLIFGVLLSCVVVPSSAADDSLSVTASSNSLLYTAWFIPSGWSCTSGDYFTSSGAFKTDMSSDTVLSRFGIGYKRSGSSAVAASNSVLIGNSVLYPSDSFYLYIFGVSFDYVLQGWLNSYGVRIDSSLDSLFNVSYQSIAPIYSSEFSGESSLLAFPGAHTLELSRNNVSSKNFLDQKDFLSYPDIIKYKKFNDFYVPYIRILLECNYSSVYLNSVVYSGSNSTTQLVDTLYGVSSLEFYPVEHAYVVGQVYYYSFDVVLGSFVNLDQLSKDAYNDGYASGYDDGLTASDSAILGQNLIGDTLSAPMTALNSFVLYTTPSGVPISLGLVLGSVIAFTFFIAFLKLFAGG